jgi:hypothetical protein
LALHSANPIWPFQGTVASSFKHTWFPSQCLSELRFWTTRPTYSNHQNQNSEEQQNVANSKWRLQMGLCFKHLFYTGLVISLFIISSDSATSGPLIVPIIIKHRFFIRTSLQPLPVLHQFSDTLSAGAVESLGKNLSLQVSRSSP